MNFTLIKEDRIIIINGQALELDFDLEDSNIRAIQYDGKVCEVEYFKGDNQLVDFEEFNYLVDLYSKEASRQENERIAYEASDEYKLIQEIAEAKAFLDKTDHKDLPNYEPNADEVLADVINARSVAREFIRKNK